MMLLGKRVSSRCDSLPSWMLPKMVRPLVAPKSTAKKLFFIKYHIYAYIHGKVTKKNLDFEGKRG